MMSSSAITESIKQVISVSSSDDGNVIHINPIMSFCSTQSTYFPTLPSHGDSEPQPDDEGGKPRPPSLLDADGGLGKDRKGRGAESASDDNGKSVNAHGQHLPRPAPLAVQEAGHLGECKKELINHTSRGMDL